MLYLSYFQSSFLICRHQITHSLVELRTAAQNMFGNMQSFVLRSAFNHFTTQTQKMRYHRRLVSKSLCSCMIWAYDDSVHKQMVLWCHTMMARSRVAISHCMYPYHRRLRYLAFRIGVGLSNQTVSFQSLQELAWAYHLDYDIEIKIRHSLFDLC